MEPLNTKLLPDAHAHKPNEAEDAIEVALEILGKSGRYAASAHLIKSGMSFRNTVRILSEPLKRRHSRRSPAPRI